MKMKLTYDEAIAILQKAKRQAFCLTLLFAFFSVSAQTRLAGSRWHDGEYFYTVEAEDDTAIWVNTSSLHDGAVAVPWRKTQNAFVYCYKQKDADGHYKQLRDSMLRKIVAGQELMLVYGTDKKLNNILLRYDGRSRNRTYAPSHGFDTIQERIVRTRIKGRYTIPETETVWVITDDSLLVYDASPSAAIKRHMGYSLFREMDYPTQVLKLDDKRYLYYEFTLYGLDVFEGVSTIAEDPYSTEGVDKGKLYCHLHRQNQDTIVPGHWPEASTMILTRGYLSVYPTEVLRFMRNEIYARRNYPFHDESLTSFFSASGDWYHPDKDLLKIEFSEIESLNFKLIQAIERERKNSKP